MEIEAKQVPAILWFLVVANLKLFAFVAVIFIVISWSPFVRKMISGHKFSLQKQSFAGAAVGLFSILISRFFLFLNAFPIFSFLAGYYGGLIVGAVSGGCLALWALAV